jgi:hypothetical protein
MSKHPKDKGYKKGEKNNKKKKVKKWDAY